MAKKVDKEEKKYTVNEICNELRLTGNNRQYVQYKYKDEVYSYDTWLNFFRNDRLTILL